MDSERMWGSKWEKEIYWTHICEGTKSWCLNSCLCRNSKEVWRTKSCDQVLGRKRQSLKLNQCYTSVQRTSTVKRGFLIIKHMAHWRINMDKTFLYLFLICVLKIFLMDKNLFNMLNIICFELFLLMVKIQNQF